MATIQQLFNNNNAITITLASLADATFATSTAIDNSVNKFISAIIQLKIKTGAAGVGATGRIEVYLIRSSDGGTTYDDSSALNSEPLGSFVANANATTYLFSIDTSKVGTLPSHWKLAVKNATGAALDATEANHAKTFAGMRFETA